MSETRAQIAKRLASEYNLAGYCSEVRRIRKVMMLKRHAHFTSMVRGSRTLEDFFACHGQILQLYGIDVYFVKNDLGTHGLCIHISLGFNEYEKYYIVENDDGLKISPVVSWQNEVCANEYWNIFSIGNDDISWEIDEDMNKLHGIE